MVQRLFDKYPTMHRMLWTTFVEKKKPSLTIIPNISQVCGGLGHMSAKGVPDVITL